MSNLNAQADPSVISTVEVPAVKQTLSGKYLTSQQAYELFLDGDGIVFLDVRDTVEIGFSGHPANINTIVPLVIQTLNFDFNLY